MLRYLLRSTIRAIEASNNTPERKGARGERWVHNAVLSGLNKDEYRVLSDVILPLGDSTTQIDHVVLSHFGIFVIETKNMSGWIFGSPDQSSWTQVLRGGKKRRFQNPLHQNYARVKAIQQTLGVDEAMIHNLIVFVGEAEPKTPMPDRVAWGMQELGKLIGRRRQRLFSTEQVNSFASAIQTQALENNRDVKREHLRNLERLAERRGASRSHASEPSQEVARCPRCEAPMARRTNRKSGASFLGCTRCPKCRGTREVS